MNEWFIKLFRSLLEWEWYDDINVKVLFIHLLLKANYKDKNWRWIVIEKGSFITSYWILASETWLTSKQIRLCLDKLKKTNEIEIKSTNNYSIVKLKNYIKFNGEDIEKDKPRANEGQTKDKPRATTNKEKNKKKEKNIINDISKDISLLEDESSSENLQIVETFWNDEINKMQDVIKNTIESLDMIYRPWKYERPRIKNIISWKAFWIVCEKHWMSRSDFVISIINLASKLKYAKKINNAVDFYENYASVYNLALQTKKWFLENKREIW